MLIGLKDACFTSCLARYKQQHFNEIATRASASLLFVSAIGIIIPTAAEHMQISQHMNGGTDSGGLPHDKVGYAVWSKP